MDDDTYVKEEYDKLNSSKIFINYYCAVLI